MNELNIITEIVQHVSLAACGASAVWFFYDMNKAIKQWIKDSRDDDNEKDEADWWKQ